MSTRPTTKHDIQRDEENITRPGFDVITNLLVSGSLSMASTGIDPGTGQVVLYASPPGADQIGVFGKSNGVGLATGTILNVSNNLLFTSSGTTLSLDTVSSGWTEAPETWTYLTTGSVQSIATGVYEKSDKIRLKQGGAYKYFICVGVSGSAMWLDAGVDFIVVSGTAISSPGYSKTENPIGFPHSFNWQPRWTNLVVGNGTIVSKKNLAYGWIDYSIEFNLGTTSIISGSVDHTHPYEEAAQTSTFLAIGNVVFHDFATAIYNGVTVLRPTTIEPRAVNAAGTFAIWQTINGTTPFTWANTDQLVITGRYRAS